MHYNFNANLEKPWNLIHPYQLPSVLRLCNNQFHPEVEAIYLFGGSLDISCHIKSDLDLYVITNSEDVFSIYEHMYNICLPLKKGFDILVASPGEYSEYQTQPGTIEAEVKKGGVLIYEKKARDKEINRLVAGAEDEVDVDTQMGIRDDEAFTIWFMELQRLRLDDKDEDLPDVYFQRSKEMKSITI